MPPLVQQLEADGQLFEAAGSKQLAPFSLNAVQLLASYPEEPLSSRGRAHDLGAPIGWIASPLDEPLPLEDVHQLTDCSLGYAESPSQLGRPGPKAQVSHQPRVRDTQFLCAACLDPGVDSGGYGGIDCPHTIGHERPRAFIFGA
jgi:hypothetical protein